MTEQIIRDEWVERAAKAAHWFRCCTVGEWHKGPSDADRKLVLYVLTAVIDDIRAEAWDEGAETAWNRSTPEVNGSKYHWRSEGEPVNPYREEE